MGHGRFSSLFSVFTTTSVAVLFSRVGGQEFTVFFVAEKFTHDLCILLKGLHPSIQGQLSACCVSDYVPRAGCMSFEDERHIQRTSLAAHWLQLVLLQCRNVAVQFLVWELRSPVPCGQKTKMVTQKQYCNKFNKNLMEKNAFRMTVAVILRASTV